jgi:hypothetical protein
MWIALLPRPALAVTLEVGVGQTYPTVAQAVAAANSGDDILVHDGFYDEAFTVTFPLTLRASAGETVTLRSTNPNNGVMRVEAGAGNLVTLAGMNLDGDGGRVVYVATGGVALVDVGVTDTGGDRKGGAVWLTATGDSATLDRCDFDQSVVTGAMHHGAFVAADAGVLTILGSTFTDGSTDEWGGAVFVNSAGTLTIRDSTFTSNQAKRGGAVYVQAGPQVEVTGSTFVDNSVQNDLGGGALYLQNAATTSVTDTVFRDNTANAGEGRRGVPADRPGRRVRPVHVREQPGDEQRGRRDLPRDLDRPGAAPRHVLRQLRPAGGGRGGDRHRSRDRAEQRVPGQPGAERAGRGGRGPRGHRGHDRRPLVVRRVDVAQRRRGVVDGGGGRRGGDREPLRRTHGHGRGGRRPGPGGRLRGLVPVRRRHHLRRHRALHDQQT